VGAAYDPYDPRHSMAQTQHSPNMSISPGGSPSPVYHQQMPGYPQQQQQAMGMGMGGSGTPPPQHYGMGTPPPQMGMATPPPQGQQNAGYMPYGKPPVQQSPPPVELPTQRGDGPVHELS